MKEIKIKDTTPEFQAYYQKLKRDNSRCTCMCGKQKKYFLWKTLGTVVKPTRYAGFSARTYCGKCFKQGLKQNKSIWSEKKFKECVASRYKD